LRSMRPVMHTPPGPDLLCRSSGPGTSTTGSELCRALCFPTSVIFRLGPACLLLRTLTLLKMPMRLVSSVRRKRRLPFACSLLAVCLHRSLLMLRALDLTGKAQPSSMPACTLPLRAEVLGALCCRELRQRAADVREDGRNRSGDLVNAGDGCQGDQANEKGILNQILTFLTVHQVLKLHIHC